MPTPKKTPKKTTKEKFNLESFIDQFKDKLDPETATVQSVDAFFASLSSLTKKQSALVIDAIETEMAMVYREVAEEFRNDGEMRQLTDLLKMISNLKQQPDSAAKAQLEFLLNMMEASLAGADDVFATLAALNHIFINIHNIKGDKSDPVVKTVVEELGKMTAEEKASAVSRITVFFEIFDKISELPESNIAPTLGNKPALNNKKGPGPGFGPRLF